MDARIIDSLPYKTTIIPKRIYNICKDMYKNCIGKDYNKDIFSKYQYLTQFFQKNEEIDEVLTNKELEKI